MATSNHCSMCEKGTGAYNCIGCQAYFCWKHFEGHREQLFKEMEIIIENRNGLHEKMNTPSQQNDSRNSMLSKIDDWEREIINKVKQAAEQARQQVSKFHNTKQMEMKTQFDTLSQELIELKESRDFVENDLARLKQTIQQLNEDLDKINQPTALELHVEESEKIAWHHIIYIVERSINTGRQQREQQVTGNHISF